MTDIIGRGLRSLLALNPSPWRWKVGLESALGLGIPGGIIALLGYEDEALMASMGAFTALYYSSLHPADRARLLPFVGAGFILASTLGVLAGSSMILTILLLIGLTTVTSITALGIGLGSPGPMMFVLVSGVSNNIARSGAYSDAPLGTFTVPVVLAMGAIGSSLIVSAPLLLPTERQRTMPRPSLQALLQFSHWDLTNRIIAYRVITSATIATLIAVPAGFDHAYWVVLVAGVVLQLTHSLRRTVIRVAHRMLGTIVGVGVFALIAQYLPTGIWLVVVLALLQGAIEIVVARNYGLALVFMTPLALTIATRSGSTPMRTVIAERLLDTLLGLGITLLVLLVSEWLIRRTTDARGRLP